MAGRERGWYSNPPKPKVPESTKKEIEKIAIEFVESVLKPEFIKPRPQDSSLNYLVDIFTKWRGNYFYFYAKYRSPGPHAVSPFFEGAFIRLEFMGEDSFKLAYMRHTGKWWVVFTDLSLEECIETIRDMPVFTPFL